MLKRFAFYCFLCVINLLGAQQPASIQLTEKDGLPDIEFYNIIEDANKFIWLAADKGLYKYDGQTYTYYSNSKQRGNAVFGTLEDDKGRIWCNNVSGQFFYAKGDTLELFIDFSEILNGELSDFVVTKSHLIIFSGHNIYNVNLIDKTIKKRFRILHSQIGTPLKVRDNYYYSHKNKIVKADASLETIDSINVDIYNSLDDDFNISKRVNISSDGNVFFCHFLKFSKNIFYRLDFNTKKYSSLEIPLKLKNSVIHQILFVNNNIWAVTNTGIYVLQLVGNTLVLKDILFKDIFTTKVIVDSDTNYWITTKGYGIFILPNINIFKYDLPKNLANVSVLKKTSSNSILIGTNNGRIAALHLKNSNTVILDSSSVLRVTNILKNSKSTEAIVTKEDNVLIFDINNGGKTSLNKKKLWGAKKLSSIRDTAYILSSYKNALLLDENFSERKKLVNKRSYTNFYSQKSNTIYVSSILGLSSFDENLHKYEIIHNDQPILGTSISETSNGIVWLSTFKKGILGIKNNEVLFEYTTHNGLLSNKTGCLKADGNDLWIVTEKGIQLLNTTTKEIKNLTKKEGIPTYRINDIEVLDNTILFASNDGLFGINKNKIFKKRRLKEIYFTEVKINEVVKPLRKNYLLDYNENKVSFSFNINGFQSNINTHYEYRLLGTDSIWRPTKDLVNSVSYNSLASGKYTFEVKTSETNENINSIQFTILIPFWRTWWFYALVILILSYIIYESFTIKIKKIEKKQKEVLEKEMINKQLVLSQLENLRSQMNPHFIFNALNSIQEYIVFNEKDLASSYLIKFSRLIRIYLDHSREDEVLLSEEIKALEIYLELEKNRFEDLLEYTITIFGDLKARQIKIPSLFIQPYIENALKHGLLHKKNDRRLLVNFYLNDHKVVCSIEDNGIGIEASKKINKSRNPSHKSFATSANEKRVRLLNANRLEKIKVETISLASGSENGTKILITIPFSKK